MNAIILQGWDPVEYKEGRVCLYPYWSGLVRGEGDTTLKPSRSSMLGICNWFWKYFFWKKYIILTPKSKRNDVYFRVGFYSNSVCKISTVVRSISDGPFAMRMGPEDCYFFAVGTSEDIHLEVAGYVRKNLDLL